jgi:NADPH-dependent 2,4-dienoyl-CoA reductase/sulfur reductase-like enzyme
MSTTALRVVIIGGGIGGAAAANALLQRGIDVQVYEQAAPLTEVGAGVGLHPNSVRLLRRLGLGAELERYGARQVDRQFWRSDGTFIGPAWSPDQARAIESYGMHRADLLGMLVDRLPPDVVTLGHRCLGFEQDAERAMVVFANGERATADLERLTVPVGRITTPSSAIRSSVLIQTICSVQSATGASSCVQRMRVHPVTRNVPWPRHQRRPAPGGGRTSAPGRRGSPAG